MERAVISTKGQLVIPKKFRQKYGLFPQTIVEIVDTGQNLVLVPIPEDPIKDSRGMLRGTKISTQSLLRMKKEERQKEKRLIKK
ncbi:AbrB/MazE/SpoVT family DNA-binding domain-containing protein [candidate division KSB1 bacterium]|nr:AbrB/MazE/SpoVT family DNA-binding domain-containing protein [candidate division KSB1 bacterium]